ncbi:MAG: hypothetical protein EI684_22190 [Candidatus Viridilinea halotolerans]|uniref:EfeO-type cupredoxin-like domain-containing protein n=1 Tax=Candidatus Viridilinea halotolerans TaxID=2491704 RepID=A0A426TQY6_9CHLR|nr:MAG: hypothetical protein EI684_22190 [Candidatus Viridilinea halotolerans]
MNNLRTFGFALLGLGVVLAIGGTIFWMYHERQEAQRSLVVTVAPGTAAALAAGEEVDLFPQELILRLSEHDTLVVRNDDSEPLTIGPYRVAPGQRFVQRYMSPGTFELYCSLHGDEALRIVVVR